MAKTKVKVQEEIPGTDTALSRLCDKFLDGRGEVEAVRKTFQAIEAELIKVLRAAGKKSLKHGGVTIRQVHVSEKDKVQVVSAE